MRVLQINTVCKSGSTGKIAYDLHTSLIQEGHESSVCYGRGNVINEPGIYKFGSELGFRIHVFITRVFGITGMASNWSTNKLLRYIKEFNPDIVHIHNIHGYYVNIYRLLKYLKKNEIKTVITMHDDWLFTGNCAGYYMCEDWKNECKKCKFVHEYPKSILLGFSHLQYKLKKKMFKDFKNLILVSPSKWLANRAKKSFLMNKDIYVIHNGIDINNIFYPRKFNDLKKKHNLENEKIILAVTPNFSDERKGGRYILELAREFYREERSNIRIIIIGVNEKVKDIPNNVIMIPRIENQIELAQYYSMADIFLITSQCENYPTVCLEALACKTMIIGFKNGGTEEIVNGLNGKLVELGDIKELKNIAEKLIESGREISIDKSFISKEIMSQQYLKLYIEFKESK